MPMYYNSGSPGISITETYIDDIVINQSVSTGACVGKFEWGPAETITTFTNEAAFAETHGRPTNENFKDFFTCANFLAYSQNLQVARAISHGTSKNAASNPADAQLIKSYDHFISSQASLVDQGKASAVYARYPGAYGNRIRVVLADKHTIDHAVENTGSEHILKPYINQLLDDQSVCCAVFVDNELKEFGVYSLDKEARTYSGATNYLFSAVNTQSNYIFLVDQKLLGNTQTVLADPGSPEIQDDLATPDINEYQPAVPPSYIQVMLPIDVDAALSGGADGTVTTGDFLRAWDMFSDPDNSDVSILMQGGASIEVGSYIANTIAEMRKDSIACVSAQLDDIANLSPAMIMNNLKQTSEAIGYSRFRFMDGNYKFQYDKYNDVYRWVPLNGDIGGIFAQTDAESAPWFSPGGKTVKNTVKLAFYPTKADRDILYQHRINPVTSFRGTGAILYGDWTGSPLEKADNFVNVRRMLNYIQKSIQFYARNLLWQLNDAVTATAFEQSVDPFLRNIQGGRGLAEYKLICDETINPPEIVGTGQFRVRLLVRPVFSIRHILLEFSISRNQSIFNETVI